MRFYLDECWFLIALFVMLLLRRSFESPQEETLWLSLSSILLIIHLVKTFKDAFWNSHRFYQAMWVIAMVAFYTTFYFAEFNKKGLLIPEGIVIVALLLNGLGLHLKDSDPKQASVAYIYIQGLGILSDLIRIAVTSRSSFLFYFLMGTSASSVWQLRTGAK